MWNVTFHTMQETKCTLFSGVQIKYREKRPSRMEVGMIPCQGHHVQWFRLCTAQGLLCQRTCGAGDPSESHSVSSAGCHETTLAWKQGHLFLINVKMSCVLVAALVELQLNGVACAILRSDADP